MINNIGDSDTVHYHLNENNLEDSCDGLTKKKFLIESGIYMIFHKHRNIESQIK